MELVAGLVVVLGPFVALMVLLVIRTRQLWPKRGPVAWTGGAPGSSGRGGDTSGDREPRRPLVPAGAGSVALPEPVEDIEADEPVPVRVAPPVPDPHRRLRAS